MGEPCMLCPRLCGVDRAAGERGVCGQGADARVARASLHFFEEPPISGVRGSGTVFFVGCSLGCVFCQNRAISRGGEQGRAFSPAALADLFLSLQERGAHNINLVTATHFAPAVAEALALCRTRLQIPVVYNSSGYERVETLRLLDGLVDIYLPDYKYRSPALAERYSAAPDYPDVADRAVREMIRQTGGLAWTEDGPGGCSLLRRGVVVRHLILPGHRADSTAVLDHLAERFPKDAFLISLMSQYTPTFAMDTPYRNLHRKLTAFEYDSVAAHAAELGLDGFIQERSSASSVFTPDFSVFSDEK